MVTHILLAVFLQTLQKGLESTEKIVSRLIKLFPTESFPKLSALKPQK